MSLSSTQKYLDFVDPDGRLAVLNVIHNSGKTFSLVVIYAPFGAMLQASRQRWGNFGVMRGLA